MATESKVPRKGKVPAELGTMIATTHDGRDITRPFTMGLLEQPRDPRLMGAADWGVYDTIWEDPKVFSALQQRKRAVVSYNYSVVAGDEEDPRSVKAAEAFSKTIARLGWDNITEKMLHAVFTGFAAAEIKWAPRDGLIDFEQIKVKHARRFRFTPEGELRLLTRANSNKGEPVPDCKFWTLAVGGTDDDEMYGMGLAHWLYWPTLFKRNGIRFWNTFVDRYALPTNVAKYPRGSSQEAVQKVLAALTAAATDKGIAVPEGFAIELLQPSVSGISDFEKLIRYMDEEIITIILSQTMTTLDGASLSQAKVHDGVRLEVVKADADIVTDSFTNGPARWWTDMNFGADVAAPIVRRMVEEETDLAAQADTDTKLKGLGWKRDEQSFRDTYGEGYEPADEPAEVVPTAPPAKGKPALQLVTDAKDDVPAEAASFAASDPRPLYVHRKLLNAGDVLEWAREQLPNLPLLKPEDMHVTVAYSRRPVNWMKMGGQWGWNELNDNHTLPPGGPRIVERIGDNAIALFFFSGHLDARNAEMRAAGASWDYPGYQPHVSLTYSDDGRDLTAVTPYRGELRFGPEIFEPIEDAWAEHIRASFAAPTDREEDAIDPWIDNAIMSALKADHAPLIDALIAATDEATARAVLDGALPGMGTSAGDALARASFAARIKEQER